MSDPRHPTTCQQAVSAVDDCCREEVCDAPATWIHVASGATLCDEHEANARKWSSGGTWRVGVREVSYPAGWEPVDGAGAAGSPLLRVEVGSGFVIEREPLSH